MAKTMEQARSDAMDKAAIDYHRRERPSRLATLRKEMNMGDDSTVEDALLYINKQRKALNEELKEWASKEAGAQWQTAQEERGNASDTDYSRAAGVSRGLNAITPKGFERQIEDKKDKLRALNRLHVALVGEPKTMKISELEEKLRLEDKLAA